MWIIFFLGGGGGSFRPGKRNDQISRTLEICAVLGYYTVSNGNPLPTFRDNVSVLLSRVKTSNETESQ
jgi:hypothetical protein